MTGATQSNPHARSDSTLKAIAPQLVGVWNLVSYVDQQEGLDDYLPFGPKPEGLLIYTNHGYVSAQLMKPGRAPFQSRWQEVTAEEFKEAGSGYIGYCGLYEVDEGQRTVTHIPSVSFLPNWINGRQIRVVELRDDNLILRLTYSLVEGRPLTTSRLEWKRATAL